MSDDANSSFTQSAARKKEYKHLLEVGGEAANNVDNKTIAENFIALRDLVTESNKLARQGQLADRIGQSAEVVLDAQVCKLSTELMCTTVQKIENNEFVDETFAVALKEHVLDENGVHDWSKMDKIVAGMAKTFNPIPSMFGTFDFDDQPETSQAAEKQRRTRRKADPTTEKRPTSVDQAENPDGRTSKVEHVFNQIQEIYKKNGHKPIPYFHLVIDPTNMMYTFDNTFQISFLFRDGNIAFVKDAEGLPAIKPIDPNNAPPKPAEMTSFTSSLSNQIIQKYIKKYNIREPLLKIPRE